ncbi:hypothetical protein ACIOWI_34210 [Streptomyces sp. NPDC087659]|uniref:hypothetical protein n=1 Tax=Streptomyces sp. NPDC087659 TaxID=3365801 RepID=UPI00382FB486
MPGDYDETSDTSQRAELYAPDNDGLYTSQLHDWIPLCPQLRDSAVRLYWIMRALVIEKHGPVRKLTLLQLCYLLPAKPVKPGEPVKPSSLARIRSLLTELSGVKLISTPEGKPVKTSSRASASGAALRIRINDLPRAGYDGPRNAFALLAQVRKPAAEAAEQALKKERERTAKKRAEQVAADAGQISSPAGAGQISSPRGQISSPRGQISSPHSSADLQDREPPFSPPAHTLRSDPTPPVRPSVQVDDACAHETEGRTDGGEGEHQDQDVIPAAGAVVGSAAADAAPDNSGSNGGEVARPVPVPVDPSPGVLVLRAVAAECPEWTINHAESLRDQGLMATGMLASGFTPQEIRHALVSRPLPQPMTHTVAAVVGRRLKDLLAAGPAADVALIPAQTVRAQLDAADDVPSVALPDSYAVKLAADVAGHGKLRNCQGDNGLCDQLAAPGSDLCGRCQNGGTQPLCAGGCGRKVVAPGARCIPCTDVPTPAAEIGDCPGWDGKPCGRAVLTAGLCRTCKFESEKAKLAADAEWEAVRTAAVEAATAAEAPA